MPAILQPSTSVGGVSGGGPDQLTTALQALWGAVGALKGALEGVQGVQGGGGSSTGCSCAQAQQGADALGSGANAAPAAPKPETKPKSTPPADSWKASKGYKIHDPLPGAKRTSPFGEVASIRGGRPHTGTDLAKGQGTPILAAAPGKVSKVGFEAGGAGNYVVIDHGNGWKTMYGHMVEKPSVKEGDVVKADQQIGKVGSTGNSTGPHLHFEVRKDDKAIDAAPFLAGDKTFS